MEKTFNAQLIKKDGKIVYRKKSDEKMYKMFLDAMEEGDIVNITLDATGELGKSATIARIHKCIRSVAHEAGEDFNTMKNLLKKEAGLCIKGECKSLADLSEPELQSVLQVVIAKGDFVGINLR